MTASILPHKIFRLEAEKIHTNDLYKQFKTAIQNAKELREVRGEIKTYGDIYPEMRVIAYMNNSEGYKVAFADVEKNQRSIYINNKKKDLRAGRKSIPWIALFLEWMCVHAYESLELFYDEWGEPVPDEFDGVEMKSLVKKIKNKSENIQIKPDFQRSLEGIAKCMVVFENQTTQKISIFWLDFIGKEIFYREIESGEEFSQPSFIFSAWSVRLSITGMRICAVSLKQAIEVITITDEMLDEPW